MVSTKQPRARGEGCHFTKPVVIEFKFRSCKTHCVDEGEWNGVLHVPMMQDPLTGRCKVPRGTTVCKGTVHREDRYHPEHGYSGQPFSESFEAKFTRRYTADLASDLESSLQKFELGYDLSYVNEEFCIDVDIMRADEPHRCENERARTPFMTVPHNAELSFGGKFKVKVPKEIPEDASDDEPDYLEYNFVPGDKSKYLRHLDQWEQHAGGILQVYARASLDMDLETYKGYVLDADYKIKLYTVLSCHAPNEDAMAHEPGTSPNWAALEKLLTRRFPKKPSAWAARAVGQYQLFLELKIAHNDWDSEKFSPSAALDEVWHAHLSFVDRYQRDVLALTGGARLIEHSPVLGDDARGRYKACHKAHVARMRAAKQAVDNEFWPAPSASGLRADEHDDDSDDHMAYGSDAGGPSCG